MIILRELFSGQILLAIYPETGKWTNFYLDFKSSITSGDVEVVLINNKKGGLGNDLAIDDISFSPCSARDYCFSLTSLDVFTTGVCDNLFRISIRLRISVPEHIVCLNLYGEKSTDGENRAILGLILSSASTNNVLNVAAGSYQNNDLYRFLVGESTNISSPSCRVYSSKLQGCGSWLSFCSCSQKFSIFVRKFYRKFSFNLCANSLVHFFNWRYSRCFTSKYWYFGVGF